MKTFLIKIDKKNRLFIYDKDRPEFSNEYFVEAVNESCNNAKCFEIKVKEKELIPLRYFTYDNLAELCNIRDSALALHKEDFDLLPPQIIDIAKNLNYLVFTYDKETNKVIEL